MKTSRFLLAALALTACAISVQAHGLWVGSNRYFLEYPGKTPGPLKATLYTGWGHRLPIDEPVAAERFGGFTLWAPDGQKRPVTAGADGYHAATIEIDRAGAWLAASANKPGFSTRVKNADDSITYLQMPKHEVPAGKKVVESNYIRTFGKTLIHVKGKDAPDMTVTKPIGHDLELVPLKNPALAKIGDTVPVQVMFKGKPYLGDPIEVTAEHIAAAYVGKAGKWSAETDKQGRVNLPIGLHGVWSLLVTVFEPAGAELKMKADQTRFRATFTFEVAEAATNYH
jgi:hypothetical protein